VEPITHGILGATLGQAFWGRSLGRRALAFGAFAEMLPDVDIVMNWSGPMGEFLYHRGFTHSVWFGPAVGSLLGWVAWRRYGRRPETLAAWVSLFVVGILTHPLLDLCTSYGTQLLSPFSNRRFVVDAIAIVDPAYTLLLLAALAVGAWRGVASREARRAAVASLILSTAYLGYGYALNEGLEARTLETIARETPRTTAEHPKETIDVHAYPTLLQVFLRRVVVRRGDEIRVGWVSTWRADDPGRWQAFLAPADPRIEAARATREGRIFEWFAAGQTAGRVVDNGTAVEIDDLRYGVPGRPRNGLWGIHVPLDSEGRPTGPVTRFNRPLPDSPSRLVRDIFREAFLN
jgi:inner membrane protein